MVTGNSSGAFGTGQTVNGIGSFGIGDPNTINGNASFVLGDGNAINGGATAGFGDNVQVVGSNNTIASTASAAGSSVLGNNNIVNATNAVVLGNGSAVSGAGAVAIGTSTQAAGINAVVVGSGARANFANSAAFGSGATATRANQQVFGTVSNTYTISGITSEASRAAQSGPTQIVTSDGGGNLATSTAAGLGLASATDVANIGSQISAINSQINAINGRLDNLTIEARAGTALALASTGLQYDPRPGKASLAAAIGNYKGVSGFAVGFGYAVNARLRVNASVSGATAINDYGGVVGASLTLN
jgi:autotransporter adhesin